jgi:mRNA-degrading endonuclease RelE of RelBE toxin-antitoxin system
VSESASPRLPHRRQPRWTVWRRFASSRIAAARTPSIPFSGVTLNASRRLEQVWDVIDDLEHMPSLHNLAPENAFVSYEMRRALVGDYMILFTIDDDKHRVTVIGFRHGSRLPRPDDLQ